MLFLLLFKIIYLSPFSNLMDDLSIIIPIYNEEHNILPLYDRLSKVVQQINVSTEYIFVNDGSHDRSIALIKELASKNHKVRFIDFSRNFGHQVAVTAGLDYCKGRAVAIIDADLQDPPELIPEMYKKLNEGFDVIYAKRKTRKDRNVLKKFAYKVFYRLLARISSVPIPLDTGDFRIMTYRIVNQLRQMPEKEKFLRGQIAWIGFKQDFIEYDRDARMMGEPGYTYKKLFKLALDGITSFSNLPLRFATWAGIIVSIISFLMIIYALYGYYFAHNFIPQGWTSLLISILFIGGVQLISIGIIGEYMSRLNANIRNRPLYIVNETNTSRTDQ
jgi:glycosyltransferase involved in cell wall biosynthesis